ncbi:MAG: FAD:protein FMN transferase [Planctomycetales bacterium]|nr:FAD:protein FMN transferase [Planctomycetales bacterium]
MTTLAASLFSLRHCLLLLVFVVLPGCQSATELRQEVLHFTGGTMGTSYSVRFVAEHSSENPPCDLDAIQQRVDHRLGEINRMMSTYDAESEISRFNQYEATDWFPVSAETAQVVEFALRVAVDSLGAFDPTVGPVVNLWGFGPEKPRKQPPSADEIAAALLRIGHAKLGVRSNPPALRKSNADLYVDLSAIAKGFGVDEISQLLSELGYANSMVEIGGEVRTRGSKPGGEAWRIGVEKPDSRSRSLQRVFQLHDSALATSGDYRNFFEHEGVRYSHTIDPATARPVQHKLATVSVLADSCLEADALATALLVMGDQKGYDWCVERKVAALFLIRYDTQIEERMTPRFEALTARNQPAVESEQ